MGVLIANTIFLVVDNERDKKHEKRELIAFQRHKCLQVKPFFPNLPVTTH